MSTTRTYASVGAIESNSLAESQKWLTYWVLCGLIMLFEFLSSSLIEWLPFWLHIKVAITLWLVFPYFEGAAYAYDRFVRPCFVFNLRSLKIGYWLRSKRDDSRIRNSGDFLLLVEKYVQEKGSEALEELVFGKDVNGKEVQIQITGFMEKSTGKFMKELWGLLLSAQSNASGVPQQFLDAKEEEIRKKKAETDRIAHEIQKKKEIEQEKRKKMDEEVDIIKATDKASNPTYKHSKEDKGFDERNGFRGKNRSPRSSQSREHSPSPARVPRSRSISKSFSNSRSYSDDRHKSRSMSRSLSKRRSISPDRRYHSPRKQSLSPRRKYSPRRPRSPIRQRSPYSRHRSSSYARRRSPSPRRRRSPSPRRRRSPTPVLRRSPFSRRRRSPSPRRRRSPSPRRRRSPSIVPRRSPSFRKRRSLTPVRRESPTSVRRASPSLVRRRTPSPVRRRSPPIRRRSRTPIRRRSPSPVRQRSPIAIRRRSPSPRYRSASPPRRRSPPVTRSPRSPRHKMRSGSPHRSPSPVYRRRRSLSKDRDIRTNGVGSRRYRDDYVSERIHGRKSPHQNSEREYGEHSVRGHKDQVSVAQPPISLRSPQRDPRERSDIHREKAANRDMSPSKSGSSLQTGISSPSEDKRTSSLSEGPMMRTTKERAIRDDSASPVRQARHSSVLHDNEEHGSSRRDGGQRIASPRRRIEHSPKASGVRNFPTKNSHQEDNSPVRLAGRLLGKAEQRLDDTVIRKKNMDTKSEKAPSRMDHPRSLNDSPHRIELVGRGPGLVEAGDSDDELPSDIQKKSPSPKVLQRSYSRDDHEVDEKKRSRSHTDSENDKYKSKAKDRRKHKRQDRHNAASDDETSSDSHMDERKEAKRRKKEEKRLRKEEKRRRREERHRRREHRRAEKLKAKNMDTVARSIDADKKPFDADDSDDNVAAKIDSHPSDTEENESEQKRLEIELRKKALESLRAKKAINL